MFRKLEIVSRWIVFSIDFCLCILALALAKIVRHNFVLQDINAIAFYKSILILMIVNAMVFFSMRTFAGIVRYTSIRDSIRILLAVSLSATIIYAIHSLFLFYKLIDFISNTTIIIQALFSFLFLITYRILIKYFFMYLKNLRLNKIRVIIYGAGEAGVATKRTFDYDGKINKNIIAFVDDDLRKVGKTIDGIQILPAQELKQLIINHEVDEIIFAAYALTPERKDAIVDICLNHKVNVLNIPSPEVWANGRVTTAQIQNIHIEDILNRAPIDIDIEGIKNQLKNKRILITGAAGSIGSEIVRQLLKFETGLIILCDQNETALHHIYLELEESYNHNSFVAFVGDVKDDLRMEMLFNSYKPHYVYHAAAYKHVPLMEDNPVEAIKTNVLGTKTIADCAVKHGVQKFVMISTDKAVNPTNIMGASKRIAEIYVQALNDSLHSEDHIFSNGLSYINELEVKPITKYITTRFGNVLGSNGSVIPRFKEQIEKGGPVTVTHPEVTRYFMTIPESCRLVLEAGCMGKGGEIFIFDMGKSVKIIDLAKKMIRLAGFVPHQDIKIVYSGLRPGEKLFEELLNDKENTMPTHHEKIMIGKVREYSFNEIEQQIYQLIKFAIANDKMRMVTQMKKMVPEFKSRNSVFEGLD